MKIEEKKAYELYEKVKKHLLNKKDEIKLKYNKKECELPYLTNEEVYEEQGYAEIKKKSNLFIIRFARRHLKDEEDICLTPSFYVELCAVFNGELFTIWQMKSEKTELGYKSDATSTEFPFNILSEKENKIDLEK